MTYFLRIIVAILAFGLLAPTPAHAENTSREAGKHFQRGVELYNDGDFRGALVEFKKAYQVWPRANVLYDIGQTEYQLLDYASALKTMERYLAETGPNAVHRQEVENTVEVLRGRVGRIALTTDAGDCEVTIDDQAAGTTPILQPVAVSVGARRVLVTCNGHPAASRQVEVAAGETVRVDLKLPPQPSVIPRSGAFTPAVHVKAKPTKQALTIGWAITSVLAAATIGVGVSTLVEQSQLGTLKRQFPVTKETLDRQAGLTSGLSIATDALGAAALAMAGVSTYLTVKYEREHKALRLGFSGTQVTVGATF
jgi:hypothetical protein